MHRRIILGISAYYHDSAAALLIDGEIIAAAQEERFSRKKHDDRFPSAAIQYALREAGLKMEDVDIIAFYDKPYLKFERLLETYHLYAPKGFLSFVKAMPIWIKEKLLLKRTLKKSLEKIGKVKAQFVFPEHHLSHASSAFYPSPFDNSAILTVDGVGEWATTTISKGTKNNITLISELQFPHSLGLLYSAFTHYCGFKVNSGEYKLMGLAPYGNSNDAQTNSFKTKILNHLIDIREDGSFLLNMAYFDYAAGLKMTLDSKWESLFKLPRRQEESALDQSYMNLALAIQQVTEEVMLKLAKTAKKMTNCDNLVLAGGVALNCVANGKIAREKIFKNIWVQPASGDAGGALGAAYAAWFIHDEQKRIPNSSDSMKGSYLGPSYSEKKIIQMANRLNAPFQKTDTSEDMCQIIANYLYEGKIVGWFQGRMEFGPRALGARSILADPTRTDMQKKLNLNIKYRESFRPFAPSVIEEDAPLYFKLNHRSPYMLMVAPIQDSLTKSIPANNSNMTLYDKLYQVRSDLPAITHIDYSARIQTVSKDTNPTYWKLLSKFKQLSGKGVLINTSFNVRGEPIVCSPEDAYRCFMNTEMDVLAIENLIFVKTDQPKENIKSLVFVSD